MSKFNSKIYLKDSDKARLADKRVRIVQETDAREPCDNEDLVFEKAEDESLIPADALFKWSIDVSDGDSVWFFTTAERCKKMVSPDPSYWTFEKLQEFARIEKKLYENWRDGYVYGYIVEHWNDAKRKWETDKSLWEMYGAKDVIDNIADELNGDDILVCIDEEWMKYEFNTERKVNELE